MRKATTRYVLLLAVGLLMMARPAAALTIGFVKLTNSGNTDVASQLFVEITDATLAPPNDEPAKVAFKFTNNVGTASSITDIYFADGTLLGISTIADSGAGVAFAAPASPGNLPGGNLASPPFVTTQNFSLDSNSGPPGVSANGVNAASEWVTVTFDLINGKTFADTVAALNDGSLRIGLHVQSIGVTSGSDSYINTVPDGGLTISLLGMALAGLGLAARRRQ
jgi:hypothetical protein